MSRTPRRSIFVRKTSAVETIDLEEDSREAVELGEIWRIESWPKREPEDNHQVWEKLLPEPEADHKVWRKLPPELVEKCLGYLPVLEIASTLRGVNRAWRDYPGTLPFVLRNHGMNLNSSFGFLMYGRKPFTSRFETMTINHEALKWQMAPSLQLHGNYSKCKVKSLSEGLLLLSLRSDTPRSRSFIVWNPLLRCEQAVPGISQDYKNVNLVVDRATGTFKIVAFSVALLGSYRGCLTYSPTTGSWQSVNHEAPIVDGLFFSERGFTGDHIAIAFKNCVYVAVESFRDGVREIGDLCYDVERNVWKPAVVCGVPPAIMELYEACFTRSLFVVNDVMYKVVVYEFVVFDLEHMDIDRPHPTVQILARSLAPANNGGAWAVIASTMIPYNELFTHWVGYWYARTLEGHEKPTICGLFMTNGDEGPLYMMMYDVGMSTWKDLVNVTNAANNLQPEEDICIMVNPSLYNWSSNERKWKNMRMVPHYTPSWICCAADCTHHQIPPHASLVMPWLMQGQFN